MKKRTAIISSILALSFVIIYLIDSNFGKKPLDVIAVFRTAGSAGLITFVGYFLWNNFAWSMKPLLPLHKKPVLKGTWSAEFIAGMEKPLYLELKIRQSFDNVAITMKNREFISQSLVSNLIQDASGSYLYFVYVSKPRKKSFNIHQIHHGTMRLHFQELALVGQYFTSNGLSGNIEFYRRGIDGKNPNEKLASKATNNDDDELEG